MDFVIVFTDVVQTFVLLPRQELIFINGNIESRVTRAFGLLSIIDAPNDFVIDYTLHQLVGEIFSVNLTSVNHNSSKRFQSAES